MSTLRDLDVVARELRMAIWMARPGAMLRMGPGMGMTITPAAQQQQQQLTANQSTPILVDGVEMQPPSATEVKDAYEYEGGSDILVYGWRNGTERTKVVKKN